jgi:16S rRNA (cytosine967-C5)-methyltransferase
VVSPARAAAFEILRLVEGGGYASDLLFSRSGGLDSRDAGLASEIVLGSLRFQGQLDFLIERLSGRATARLDPEVRIALRMAIYQLRNLSRVPAHAAVSESVELVKRARKRSAAPLVNALLRKVNREAVAWPDRAVELSHPAWLLERWERQYGGETAEKIARANLAAPETYVRMPLADARGSVLGGSTLGGATASGAARGGALAPNRDREGADGFEPTEVPGCYRLIAGRAEGLRIQDIGSQSIVPLLDLQPGQTFLDLCAAPGNKTAQALESGVRVVACDIHLSRLVNMQGLGCGLVVVDGTRPLPFRGRFERILVDAPCSGTGTLGRNPEIKWRLQPEDFEALHRRQVALLGNALKRLAPGGRLVYSTCSLEREENEEVIAAVGAPVERLWRRLPGVDHGDGFFAAVLTSD